MSAPPSHELEPRSLLAVSFHHRELGGYRLHEVTEDFGAPSSTVGVQEGRVLVASDVLRGRVLRVRYPAGSVGPREGGAEWKVALPGCDDVSCSYRIRFGAGFDFVKGGKLPGLAGGSAPSGGESATGTNGFSARLMWRPGGAVVQYVYHPDQEGMWGDDFPYDLGGWRRFLPGTWHHVVHRVRLNTPGARDGLIQGWFDGELALERSGLRFRDAATLTVDRFFFSTFFGGNERSWAATRDEHVDFDDLAVFATSA